MNVPALRFPEFEGEWAEMKFSKFLVPNFRGVPKPTQKYLAIGIRSHGKGTFQKPDSEPEKIAMDTLYVVRENDLIVNITFAWEGAIAIVPKEDDGGHVSHRFPTYEFCKELVSHEYFRSIIANRRFRQKLELISPGGAGRNRVMSKPEFLKLRHSFPSLPEQKKIAAFLGVVDAKIAALRARVAGLERYKRGLMQALFNQTLHFTKPDGTPFPNWEEKRLGEVANCLDSKRKPLNTSERQLMQGEYPYYGANGQVDSISDFLFDEDLVLLAEDGGNFDEFTTRPIAQRVTGKCWVNNHAHILTAKSGRSTHAFLFYSLVHKDIRKYINGSSRAKLNKSDMLTIRMSIPHPDEQAKIAEALSAMDAKIAAVSGQLDRMQDFKKGLLQQMFV